jgi:phosphomannomutase
LVKALKEKFPDYPLTYAIGGQISFDVFPHGWDKTYALGRVDDENFEEIHFFGDKTFEVIALAFSPLVSILTIVGSGRK